MASDTPPNRTAIRLQLATQHGQVLPMKDRSCHLSGQNRVGDRILGNQNKATGISIKSMDRVEAADLASNQVEMGQAVADGVTPLSLNRMDEYSGHLIDHHYPPVLICDLEIHRFRFDALIELDLLNKFDQIALGYSRGDVNRGPV